MITEKTHPSSSGSHSVVTATAENHNEVHSVETDFQMLPIQCKLSIGAVDDPLEDEADAMADKVMRMPDQTFIQRKCAHCEEEEKAQRKPLSSFIQKKSSGNNNVAASDAISSQINSTKGQGISMPEHTQSFMESRFGADFSGVNIHSGSYASQLSQELNAKAFTVGNDIYFNEGKYQPETNAGKHLLAHELTHTVQQSNINKSFSIQRDEFSGASGKTALDKDRPIIPHLGPMLDTKNPGGTIVPGTAGKSQNCAGDSCSIQKYINWPFLGIELSGLNIAGQGDWNQAINFVPAGCTKINCAGIDVNNTRCKSGEREIIVFLYKWPIKGTMNGVAVTGTQSDFHMVGRDANSLPGGWHSKMDQREKVIDIRDPNQSLHDAYPRTKLPDHTIVKLCFCCTQQSIKII